MAEIDWSCFKQRINVSASKQKLYKAIATRQGIESWFLRTSEYKHANNNLLLNDELVNKEDTYKWLWFGYDDSTFETGSILKANGEDELQFTFGKAGNVTIKIYEEDNENIVELVQENIPTDEKSKFNFYLGCSTGWVFYLANLKSIMECGVDLRNKNINLKGVLNS